MKNSNIKPTGNKGNDSFNRAKELMSIIAPITENTNVARSTEVITKLGPDGKSYAIIKENSDYYVKVSNKTSNLVLEDFNYIGGLMNKKVEAYHSYSEATKQLNMRFINLAETTEEKMFNVLRNDNLLNETLDINGGDAKEDKKTSGDNVATGSKIGVDDFEKDNADGTKDGNTGTHSEKYVLEDVEMTESEEYIDSMANESIDADFDSTNGDGDESDDYLANKDSAVKDAMKNESISIAKAMNIMDSVIDNLASNPNKIDSILENLTDKEKSILINKLKKKG